METLISYSGSLLDRAGHMRRDSHWIDAQLANPDSIIIPFWRDKVAVHCYSDPTLDHQPLHLSTEQLEEVPMDAETTVFLGQLGQRAVFAMDFSSLEEHEFPFITEETELQDLRHAVHTLHHTEVALLGYGKAVIHWHRKHRFCSVCGSPTHSKHGGHSRQCSNPDCGADNFPRTDPAVIMLVTRKCENTGEPLCLLGRNPRFPRNVYSTLAGYVDPGETLEEAVIREVKEEVDVDVDDVRYVASQPWPFPSQIMIGFHATAKSQQITVNPEEISDAKWFNAAQIQRAGDWYDKSAEMNLPRKDSIAHYLIKQWLISQK